MDSGEKTLITIFYELEGLERCITIKFSRSEVKIDWMKYLCVSCERAREATTEALDALNTSSNLEQYGKHEFVLRNCVQVLQRKFDQVTFWALIRLPARWRPDTSRSASIHLLVAVLAKKAIRDSQAVIQRLSVHSTRSIKNEALTAAESLASINEEFLNKIDSLPLHVGVKNISSLVSMNDYKMKLVALNELGRSTAA